MKSQCELDDDEITILAIEAVMSLYALKKQSAKITVSCIAQITRKDND